jgi:hypothetical protein
MAIGSVITLTVHAVLATLVAITAGERDRLRTWVRSRMPAR